MQLNKKGVTLVEVIVSISLISVILLFLYQLIATVNYERDGQNFAVNNQLQRTEIIKTINQHFIEAKATNPKYSVQYYTNNSSVTINGVISINISKNKISATSSVNSFSHTWNLNKNLTYDFSRVEVIDANLDNCTEQADKEIKCSGVGEKEIPILNGYRLLKIRIPINPLTIPSSSDNNYLDDIELTYMKKV